jgi:hypothetical protein
MNLSKATTKKIKNPFIKNKTLTIFAHDVKGKISEFEIIYNGATTKFPVKKHDILGAWQKVEAHLKNI